jgi:hypothetical protein
LVTERLLRNATDFAVAFRNFYGVNKARDLEALFREHILIAGSLVGNIKSDNVEAVFEDRKKWQQNADEIAAFLGDINPHWSARQFRTMLYSHLKMTEDEAIYRLNGKYASDIAIFDSIQAQALQMADFMAYGILNQFFLNPSGNARE